MTEIPIKMFISQPEMNEVMKKDDQVTAYIILQNNILIQKQIELIKQNDELINQSEELNSYTDRLEKSKICLQGYVRNEHDTVLKYKMLYDLQNNVYNEFCTEFVITHTVPVIMFVITPFILFIHMYVLIMVYIISVITHAVIIGCSYKYINGLKKSKKIVEILDEIKKTTQSNIYIDDLIDNI